MVDRAGAIVVTSQCQTHHTAELTRESIANYGNHADSSQRNKREGDTVVS